MEEFQGTLKVRSQTPSLAGSIGLFIVETSSGFGHFRSRARKRALQKSSVRKLSQKYF